MVNIGASCFQAPMLSAFLRMDMSASPTWSLLPSALLVEVRSLYNVQGTGRMAPGMEEQHGGDAHISLLLFHLRYLHLYSPAVEQNFSLDADTSLSGRLHAIGNITTALVLLILILVVRVGSGVGKAHLFAIVGTPCV